MFGSRKKNKSFVSRVLATIIVVIGEIWTEQPDYV